MERHYPYLIDWPLMEYGHNRPGPRKKLSRREAERRRTARKAAKQSRRANRIR